MAMILITNGDITTTVSRGAFDNQYKKMGFWAVSEDEVIEAPKPVEKPKAEPKPEKVEEPVENEVDEETDEASDDEAFVEDILEKPLSQWSKDELQKFVTIKDIDISGAKKTSEVRSIVKNYLDEIEKAQVEG